MKSFIVAKKEAQETSYWLQLVREQFGLKADVEPLLDEVEQLTRILRTIIDRLA